jgi:hypothetical protein
VVSNEPPVALPHLHRPLSPWVALLASTPDTLNLKIATPDRRGGLDPLAFLDILVTLVREPTGRIALQTLLYDKRREPAFASLASQPCWASSASRTPPQ